MTRAETINTPDRESDGKTSFGKSFGKNSFNKVNPDQIKDSPFAISSEDSNMLDGEMAGAENFFA